MIVMQMKSGSPTAKPKTCRTSNAANPCKACRTRRKADVCVLRRQWLKNRTPPPLSKRRHRDSIVEAEDEETDQENGRYQYNMSLYMRKRCKMKMPGLQPSLQTWLQKPTSPCAPPKPKRNRTEKSVVDVPPKAPNGSPQKTPSKTKYGCCCFVIRVRIDCTPVT